MSMKANDYSSGGDFTPIDPVEPGAYPARVALILNIGLQKQNPFKGKDKAPKHEFHVTYEMLDEFMKDEDGNDDETKPRWLSENFTINPLSSENAKSTARYLALDPTAKFGGDWSELLGAPCLVNVVQNASKKDATKIYNNIRSIQAMRARDAASAPDLVNTPQMFDFYEPDVKVFLSLPKFIQDKIKNALDYEGSVLEKMLEDVSDVPQPEKQEKPKKAKEAPKEEPKDDEEGEW
jgi:hypothetical protein